MSLFYVDKDTLEINGEIFHYFKDKDKDMVCFIVSESCYNTWNLNWYNFIGYNFDNMQFVYQKYENALCIFLYYPSATKHRMELSFVPLSMDNKIVDYQKVMKHIKSVLQKVNPDIKKQTGFNVPCEMISYMQNRGLMNISEMKGFFEFVYDLKYLSMLDGSKLKNVRRDYNRFKRDYPDVKLAEYNGAYRNDCIRLRKEWASEYEHRTTQKSHSIESFECILDRITDYAYVMLINDKVVGYMNAVKLYDHVCACIHRITDNRYTNSSNYILIEVSKELYDSGYQYMNDGYCADEDGEHLEQFKSKYLSDASGRYPIYKCELR